jgi:hypothetical protein
MLAWLPVWKMSELEPAMTKRTEACLASFEGERNHWVARPARRHPRASPWVRKHGGVCLNGRRTTDSEGNALRGSTAVNQKRSSRIYKERDERDVPNHNLHRRLKSTGRQAAGKDRAKPRENIAQKYGQEIRAERRNGYRIPRKTEQKIIEQREAFLCRAGGSAKMR